MPLDVHVLRIFNQIGPGMPDGLLAPDLLTRLRAGECPLVLRSANHLRDFSDVRDGAESMARLLEAKLPERSVINLCSGRGTRLGELASCLLGALGMTVPVEFASQAPDELVGDPSRLQALTGFRPRRSLSDSLFDLVRERVADAPPSVR